jgi:hypothetical protein
VTWNLCEECHTIKDRIPLDNWSAEDTFAALSGVWSKCDRDERLVIVKMIKVLGNMAASRPYGYRLAGDGVHLEQDAAEQAVLARVRDASGRGLSARDVLVELEHLGLVSSEWHNPPKLNRRHSRAIVDDVRGECAMVKKNKANGAAS